MNVLEKAKQAGIESVLDRIRKSGLKEYGICPENLADKIERLKREHLSPDGPMTAAGALNNEDTEHMLLCIAKEYPEKVLNGLCILGYLLDASELLFYIPEDERELKETMMKKALDLKANIRIEMGTVDIRRLRGHCISHLETLAAISDIIEECYRPGAYVSVKIKDTDKTEYTEPAFIPYGTAIQSILPKQLPEIKAVQMGEHLYKPDILNTSIEADTILGNGVITLYTDNCCMIAAAEELLQEKREAGCGKCTFCREGLGQLHTRLHEITTGKGDLAGINIMKEIGTAMTFSSLCSMGQTGAEFTIDTFQLFKNEYEQHIKKKKCPSGQCTAFINMYIDPAKCNACGACIPVCPINCIEGISGYIHMIEDIDCTKCGKCIELCKQNAIVRTTKRVPAIPDRLTRVGRFKKY